MSSTPPEPTADPDDERADGVPTAGVPRGGVPSGDAAREPATAWLPTPTVPFPRPAPPQPDVPWSATRPVARTNPARWGRRAAGYALDQAVMLVPLLLALAYETALMTVLGAAWWVGWYVGNRVLADGRHGQSLGKQLVGVRLVRTGTGAPPGPWGALVRDLAHLLDVICLVGFLRPLWDGRRRTFADSLCATSVLPTRQA